MRLLADYVQIRRIADEKVGRFYVPDSVETKPRIGIVEAVGPGRKLEDGSRVPMAVQVGDRVKFGLGSGYVTRLPHLPPTETRLLIRESEIEAILAPDAEASAVASPWPSYISEGVQSESV